MKPKSFIISFLTLLLLVGSVLFIQSLDAETVEANMHLAGGAMTVKNRSYSSFERPASGLSDQELNRHTETDPLFDRSHIPLNEHLDAGLGPLHNANSCAACHVLNGRGRSVKGQSLFRVALREGGGKQPVPGIGFQLQDKAIFGYKPEGSVVRKWIEENGLRRLESHITNPDGTELPVKKVARSLRIAPPLIGMGLLEAIPESDLLALSDPEDLDGDGISGRPVFNDNEKGPHKIGRFGWKAMPASVHQQSVNAYQEDMGITTPRTPESNLTEEGLPADLSWDELDGVTYYVQTLGVPATAEKSNSRLVSQGGALFDNLQCAACHVPNHHTGISKKAVATVINNQEIWPYTDLLLHDMGSGLDDGVAENGLSESSEWRTAPLWGLGLAQRVNPYAGFLHDGRARTIEEAILWHGGEAEKAKQRYVSMSSKEKNQLISWLKQL